MAMSEVTEQERSSVEQAAGRQFEAIRRVLSQRRRAIPMSMSELGRRVGVSPSMISQIERGQTLPSVGTLFSLAAVLGVTVDAFLEEPAAAGQGTDATPLPAETDPAEELYVVRGDARPRIQIHGGVSWERLTPRSLGEVEFLELVYEAGAESDPELYRHPGIEMVLVLSGSFEILLGFARYLLEEGDSILFPSSLPHRYVNPGDSTSRAVTVILRDGIGGPPRTERLGIEREDQR